MEKFSVDIKLKRRKEKEKDIVNVIGDEENVLDEKENILNLEEEYMKDVNDEELRES